MAPGEHRFQSGSFKFHQSLLGGGYEISATDIQVNDIVLDGVHILYSVDLLVPLWLLVGQLLLFVLNQLLLVQFILVELPNFPLKGWLLVVHQMFERRNQRSYFALERKVVIVAVWLPLVRKLRLTHVPVELVSLRRVLLPNLVHVVEVYHRILSLRVDVVSCSLNILWGPVPLKVLISVLRNSFNLWRPRRLRPHVCRLQSILKCSLVLPSCTLLKANLLMGYLRWALVDLLWHSRLYLCLLNKQRLI